MSWYINLAFFIGMLFIHVFAGGQKKLPTPLRTTGDNPIDAASTAAAATTPSPDAALQPEPLNQRRVTQGVVILMLTSHVAAAESFGFSFRRAFDRIFESSPPALPEPFASVLSFVFFSASAWLVKPGLARLVCERWLGLNERSTMVVRRWADGFHVVLTPVVAFALLLGSETSDFDLATIIGSSAGVLILTFMALGAVELCAYDPAEVRSVDRRELTLAAPSRRQPGRGRSTPRAGLAGRQRTRRQGGSSASARRALARRRRSQTRRTLSSGPWPCEVRRWRRGVPYPCLCSTADA